MIRLLTLISLIAPLGAWATTFRNPLDATQCGWTGGCYVTAYFDLNRASGAIRDWACGTTTYDNHAGTDIGIGSWAGMDQGRDVLAAADGVVIGVHDGEFDRCTGSCTNSGNYVWVKHADGKVSLYYHLKKDSVTVALNQSVTCGQKLGQVGSSGNSTGPHLHFQVNAVQGDSNSYDDPFAGTSSACGGSISWWVSQGGYKSLPGHACEPRPMPDVQVASIGFSPATPREGDAVTFSAVVKNTGDAATGEIVGVGFFVGGSGVSFGTVPPMAAGTSATVTAQGTWRAEAGMHEVLAFVDDVNRFAEKNENDNKRTRSLTVQALADLIITEVTASPPEPESGEAVTFTALVENPRGPTGSGFDVVFQIGDVTVATATGAALAADGSAALTASLPWTALAGAHLVRATVDPEGAVQESSKTNNTLSLQLTVLEPDADGDGARADLDCDDGAASVHPGAAERCNGEDDDCDGLSDEELDCASPVVPPAADAPQEEKVIQADASGCGCATSPTAAQLPFLLLLAFALARRARG